MDIIYSMVGLSCGFLGFGLHTLLSIHQARKKTGRRYGLMDYWAEYDMAVIGSGLILIAAYLVGIVHVEQMLEGYIPPVIAEVMHSAEHHRIAWFLLGLGVPKVMKWAQTWTAS